MLFFSIVSIDYCKRNKLQNVLPFSKNEKSSCLLVEYIIQPKVCLILFARLSIIKLNA